MYWIWNGAIKLGKSMAYWRNGNFDIKIPFSDITVKAILETTKFL